MKKFILVLLAAAGVVLTAAVAAKDVSLLNVSYDPTRELYRQINTAFAAQWKAQHSDTVTIQMSHGGSGKQARSVVDGLSADVVTLALAYDIDAIADHGLLAKDWQTKLPNNATPYTSTIVFLVRKGNPKGIKDWADLVRPGVQVVTPNPKSSGGARWNFLAAWGYALKQPGGSDATAKAYVSELFKHVPVLDTGARGATNTFVQRGIGDVLIAWENEALLAQRQLGNNAFEIVVPSVTIVAEPPVAVVDSNVDKHGTRAVAQAYVEFLYSPQGQDIAAKNFYRPRASDVAARYASQFPVVHTFTLAELFGDWRKAQAKFFNDGAVFDQLGVGS
ncbi:sulfate ABC transporter substrate-binding protein [Dyella kyungheensis]|uniref:Sulfate ABC transporter substrate-binding protein n=1 Tax=Dyella kyungheensis TaxID=1242174 RepID=A0ABS2JQH2_9GAMM|nr:sulfate ABC transporter substrate-binding protein [Dyella kyungheensis]MBM7121188.1 sulfate ABC transporter substrate-binding protein [Dyella kyungheensis]